MRVVVYDMSNTEKPARILVVNDHEEIREVDLCDAHCGWLLMRDSLRWS